MEKVVNLQLWDRERIATFVVVEGPRWGDVNFYGNWLLAAARADELLNEASRQDADFCTSIRALEQFEELDFGIIAINYLSRLGKDKNFETFLIDVWDGDLPGFALMAEMGFFAPTGDRYQMTIPRDLDLTKLKKAHLKLARTEDLEWIHPECFITDVPDFQAKSCQQRLRDMNEKERVLERESLLCRLLH